ncbi:hypothetical protein Gotri_012915 [Gossypium trilobum]|uniref:Uncharacterized protein n=1 Tax=Gossypium trilobum TaxID=34281 RepID=A0A7J9DRW6_9ROSI|nr:hypothetical protein [Gossypium trilobum]
MGLQNRCWFELRYSLLVVLNFSFGLGFYFFFKKPFLSFFEWSIENDESTTDGSKIVFHKLALPDYNSKFIFGVSNLYLVFVKYLMDIVVIYSLLGLHVSSCLQVFEYFSSFQTPKGELFMRPVDLMGAVVPVFPLFESHLVRDGYLTRERKAKNNIKEKKIKLLKTKKYGDQLYNLTKNFCLK